MSYGNIRLITLQVCSNLLIPVLDLVDPVIFSLLVAPRYTHAAGRCLEVVDRELHRTEHKTLTQMVRLVRSMNIVAGRAGPSLLTVHMKIMKVGAAVPEFCNCIGFFLRDHRLLVAVKTEVIFTFFVFSIELVRKPQSQYIGVVRTVGVMAGAAVALYDGTVQKTFLLPQLFVLVALEAQVIDLIPQQILIV